MSTVDWISENEFSSTTDSRTVRVTSGGSAHLKCFVKSYHTFDHHFYRIIVMLDIENYKWNHIICNQLIIYHAIDDSWFKCFQPLYTNVQSHRRRFNDCFRSVWCVYRLYNTNQCVTSTVWSDWTLLVVGYLSKPSAINLILTDRHIGLGIYCTSLSSRGSARILCILSVTSLVACLEWAKFSRQVTMVTPL